MTKLLEKLSRIKMDGKQPRARLYSIRKWLLHQKQFIA
jgi:hypothetical protein